MLTCDGPLESVERTAVAISRAADDTVDHTSRAESQGCPASVCRDQIVRFGSVALSSLSLTIHNTEVPDILRDVFGRAIVIV